MSWPIQPKVRLAVTRFSPRASDSTAGAATSAGGGNDKPIAGLSEAQREALRERRTRETHIPMRPDGEISRDGRFRWSAGWATWVPLADHSPIVDVVPSCPVRLAVKAADMMYCRCGQLDCIDCWNRAQYFNDYLKAKRLRDGL